MDFDAIKAIIVFLAGIAATILGQWVQRGWGKKDRELDRLQSREDKNRDERRAAYAELITATSAFLDTGQVLAVLQKIMFEKKEEIHATYIAMGQPEHIAEQESISQLETVLIEKAREALAAFLVATTNWRPKCTAALLVESDPELIARITGLIPKPIDAARDSKTAATFTQELASLAERLEGLTVRLTGAFAPSAQTALVKAKKS